MLWARTAIPSRATSSSQLSSTRSVWAQAPAGNRATSPCAMPAGSRRRRPRSSRRIRSVNSCSTLPGRAPTSAWAAVTTRSSPSPRPSRPRPDRACWYAPIWIGTPWPRACSSAWRSTPRATDCPGCMRCFSMSRRAPPARSAAGCCDATASFTGPIAVTRVSMTIWAPSPPRSARRRVASAAASRMRACASRRASAASSTSRSSTIYDLHRDTFVRHGHEPYLTRAFFSAVARALPESFMVKLAVHGRAVVAAAIFFCCEEALFGRYWGAAADYHSLHFEACYHQGIEFCIERGIARFEPGTQGEHKVSRGFEPAITWSAHYIADPQFRAAIAEYLAREATAVQAYAQEVQGHVPFRGRRSAGLP